MAGGWEEDLWLGEGWEGVLREMEVFIMPPWQWECKVAVAPLLLRWRKVSRSRERWVLVELVEEWWRVDREITWLATSWRIYFWNLES